MDTGVQRSLDPSRATTEIELNTLRMSWLDSVCGMPNEKIYYIIILKSGFSILNRICASDESE